jgi:hypothetical protein
MFSRDQNSVVFSFQNQDYMLLFQCGIFKFFNFFSLAGPDHNMILPGPAPISLCGLCAFDWWCVGQIEDGVVGHFLVICRWKTEKQKHADLCEWKMNFQSPVVVPTDDCWFEKCPSAYDHRMFPVCNYVYCLSYVHRMFPVCSSSQ